MNNKITILLLSAVMIFGCADEELGPVVTFDTAGKGAYVKLLSETERFINLFDIAGSNYVYSVEFVDIDMGNTIAEYRLELTYTDKNPANGDKSAGPIVFKTFGPSDFGSTDRGFKGMSNISVSATDLFAAVNTTADEVEPGDQFKIQGYVTTNDGDQFGFRNSSAAVNGTAFKGHFDYVLTAGCPSNLAGTFPYEGSNFWCDGGSGSGMITIIQKSAGVYGFNDWSFGAYPHCYGGLAGSWGTLAFSDVCAVVSFTGFTDNYGDTWTFDHSIDGDKWTISWSNTYGEAGTAVITHPSGAWPFTVK